MKSRITIEVNFDDNNQPYIKCQYDKDSEDVRDKLIRNFIEKLGHTSSWCKIHFWGGGAIGGGVVVNNFSINAITPADLQKEGEAMLEQARLIKDHPEQAAIAH